MAAHLIETGGPEDSFLSASGHVENVGRLLAEDTEMYDDRIVYKWNGSKAGEGLVVTVPTVRGPSIWEIGDISRVFRRALTDNRIAVPTEHGVTITLNTPESGQPAVDFRSGTQQLGQLATGLFRDFVEAAGLLHDATLRQRVGRAVLPWVEAAIGSLERLTAHGGQPNIGPYDL